MSPPNAPESVAADPLLGLLIDAYEVQTLIGEGAMGNVYRGLHTVIRKPVAIKVLKPEFAADEEMTGRLIREARSVNAINHPGIVDIFGFGTIPHTGQPYIVMALLEGEPFDKFLARRAPLPFKLIVSVLDDLLAALEAAHGVGVVHRDLKPNNIFLERLPDGREQVKLLDFGLARQAIRAGDSIDPTRPGMILGTPAFMAPEQIVGEKTGPQTDLYALGGIAYQMCTGRFPYEAPTTMEILSLKLRAPVVSPLTWNPQLPTAFCEWVLELLTRDPQARSRSAVDVRQRLRALVADAGLAFGASARPASAADADEREPKTIVSETQSGLEAAPGVAHETVAKKPHDSKEGEKRRGTLHAWNFENQGAIQTVAPLRPYPAKEDHAPASLLVALALSVAVMAGALWWLLLH
jgi:serine/threonine-protein kinase